MKRKYSDHWKAFDKKWFDKNQKIILLFLNTPIIKYIFRWFLRIEEKKEIIEIAPNYYTTGSFSGERTTTFRTHNKYSKRMYYAFCPIWWVLHFVDWLLLDRFVPEYSFGFDTLTVYCPAGVGGNGYDGEVIMRSSTSSGYPWASIRDSSNGITTSDSITSISSMLTAGTTQNYWRYMYRIFITFNTSGLGSGATISSASIYLVSDYKQQDFSTIDSDTHIVSSSPASVGSLQTTDFPNVGSTSFSSVGYSSINSDGSTYNTFSLNSSGIANISKTDISMFAVRVGADLNNTAPTWVNGGSHFIEFLSADNTGTTKDPKIVITYNANSTVYKQVGVGSSDLHLI